MKRRNPQLALRLDADAPDADAGWRDGRAVAYLGGTATLRLDTAHEQARLEGDQLHLPLPPGAAARQIQDAAESWLRANALRIVGAQVTMAARQLGRPAPTVALCFGARAGWLEADDKGGLRCNWRLIEQPVEVIADVAARAVAGMPRFEATPDLFAAA